jgi:polyhydroxyalkanoate synthesis regulator phasin
VTKHVSVFDLLKARGEEVLNQVSTELMSNKHFMKALQAAMQGKEKLDQAAARALKQMNIPTRTEFKKAVRRIEALEHELAALKAKPKRSAPRKKPAPTPESAGPTGSAASE